MVKGMWQTIQFAPWTQMLIENGLSPFWGDGAKECPSATDSPPTTSAGAVHLVPGA